MQNHTIRKTKSKFPLIPVAICIQFHLLYLHVQLGDGNQRYESCKYVRVKSNNTFSIIPCDFTERGVELDLRSQNSETPVMKFEMKLFLPGTSPMESLYVPLVFYEGTSISYHVVSIIKDRQIRHMAHASWG